jgi:predicted permease
MAAGKRRLLSETELLRKSEMWMGLKSWVRGMVHRSRMETEMDAELWFHIDAHAQELMRSGMTVREATRRARLEFGGMERTKEECREVRRIRLVESAAQDLRFGLRQLRKSPGFAAAAVFTLALGIGANTAIFSVVDWLILRPLSIEKPEQMTFLGFEQPNSTFDNDFSYPEFRDLQSQTRDVFSAVGACAFSGFESGAASQDGLTVNGLTKSINVSYVSGNFFDMMGVQPHLGRVILPNEGAAFGADPVIVLSYQYWKTWLGGDTSVVGGKALFNGRPVTVVGVVAKGFLGITPIIETQGYMPLGMAGAGGEATTNFLDDRTHQFLTVLARLREHQTISKVQPELTIVGHRLEQQNARSREDKDLRAFALKPPGMVQGPNPIPVLAGLFLLLTLLVLNLACLNVANLLLVRAVGRAREMALRAALGAARGRLIRQVLSEGMLLGLLGAVGGVLVGAAASRALRAMPMQTEAPLLLDFQTDWRVFAYALAAAIVSGLLVGIVPAIRGSRENLVEVLREGGRGATATPQRVRGVLIVLQVGGSLMLLIVAGLFIRSMMAARTADLGFRPDNVLNLTVNPYQIGLTKSQGMAFYRELLERARAIPGVESASLAATVPLSETVIGDDLRIPGHERPKGEVPPHSSRNAITPGYLATVGIRLMRGRDFSEADDDVAPLVAMVNEQFAKEFWPNEEAVGQQFFRSSNTRQAITIIGIVQNTRANGITGPNDPYEPMFYQPMAQSYSSTATLQMRTRGEPKSLVAAAVNSVNSIQPTMPISGVRTMKEALDGLNGLFLFRVGAELAGCMGFLGLALAVVGIFGVTSYVVSQRTHEIGIRMALGARPRQVMGMIYREGLVVIAVGIAIGVFAALGLTRLMSSFLVGVGAGDPVTYISVSLLLAAVALLACYLPARRAMRIDPTAAIRYE